MSRRSFRTNYPLWYALSLAVYLCSFSGMEVVAAVFFNRQHSRVFHYDIFTYEFICPVAVSIVAGWLAQCAIVMLLPRRFEQRSGGSNAQPAAPAHVNYSPLAFLGAIAVEWQLAHRNAMLPFDYTPPDIWYFENLGLIGLALLLLAPVLRHGSAWERMIAAALGVWPATAVVGGFYFAYTQLTQG